MSEKKVRWGIMSTANIGYQSVVPGIERTGRSNARSFICTNKVDHHPLLPIVIALLLIFPSLLPIIIALLPIFLPLLPIVFALLPIVPLSVLHQIK